MTKFLTEDTIPKEWLEQKSYFALERLAKEYDEKTITAKEFRIGLTSVWNTVSGLNSDIDEAISSMLGEL